MSTVHWNADDLLAEVSVISDVSHTLSDLTAPLQLLSKLTVPGERYAAIVADIATLSRDLGNLDGALSRDTATLRNAVTSYRGLEDSLRQGLLALLNGDLKSIRPPSWLAGPVRGPVSRPGHPVGKPITVKPGPTHGVDPVPTPVAKPHPGPVTLHPGPVLGGAPVPVPVPVGGGTLQEGSTGAGVTKLQQLLARDGYSPGPIDGEFGGLTVTALRQFQSEHGLPVTGIADPKTMKALANPPKKVAPPAAAGGSLAARLQAIVDFAKTLAGIPYVYGGKTPAQGLDCSGMTSWIYAHFGIHIPDGSQAQSAGYPTFDDQAQLRPGDLVFYFGSPGSAEHVAIYLGDGMVMNAPQPGELLRPQALWNPWYASHVIS